MKGFCLLLVILCSVLAVGRAQEQASPPLSGIAHVAMRVADLEASRAFYKKLGFEEAFAFDKGGSATEAFFKVNDTQFIELYPRRRAADALGFLHVCYLSRDIETLNGFYRTRGLAPAAVARGGAGNLLFSLSGPGLENIEFTQYMQGSRHSKDVGKHLGAGRIATRIAGVEFPSSDPQGAVSFYARMGFIRGQSDGAFRIRGGSADRIEILGVAQHLCVTMEVADMEQAARALRDRGIVVTRSHGGIVIRDPDGNEIELQRLNRDAGAALLPHN